MNFDLGFIQENIWTIYIIFLGFLFLYFFWSSYRKRGKIQIRIKTPLGEKIRWVKPESDGKTIVMEKAGKTKMGWSFEFTNKSLIARKNWRGGLYYAVDVFYDSPNAINYDYALKTSDQPKLTKIEAKEINRLDAFKRRYSTTGRIPSGTVQWIILFLLIGLIILSILNMQGVRIA